MYLHRSGNIATNLCGDTLKWILHSLAAAPPIPVLLRFADTWPLSEKSARSNAVSSLPPTKPNHSRTPNSAKYLLSCRDIPQRSWQRTDLPSPLELPPREDPQELDWKELWKENKSKSYGDITLRGCCCFLLQGQPTPHLTLNKRYWAKIRSPASSYRKGLQPWGQCWKQIFKSTEFGCLPEALTHQSVWSLPLQCQGLIHALKLAHLNSFPWASWAVVTCTCLCPWQTQKHNLSSPWNRFEPSYTVLHLPYAKRVYRQRPRPEGCKLTWLCVCPCDPCCLGNEETQEDKLLPSRTRALLLIQKQR